MHSDLPPPAREKKLRPHVEAVAGAYASFLKRFEVEGKPPDKVEAEQEDAFVTAHFHTARAYGKLVGVEWQRRALAEYELLDGYFTRTPVEGMEEEAKVCKEMAELLPMRIAQLAHQQ